jgi:predicted transcriptional regulator
MAKPSRSKQPAFDPAELEDLIFTPAVGSGVGSHLVRAPKAESDQTTVVTTKVATVVRSSPELDVPTVATTASPVWVTETGESVPPSRVRPIRTAPDALSSAELTVYEALWNCGSSVPGGDRVCQAGYDYLVRNTRLSRKTIQRVVDRLLEKEYIAIEKPADMYLRTSTAYRVFAERGILERQAARGRFHVVKIGPGFLYVHGHSGHVKT